MDISDDLVRWVILLGIVFIIFMLWWLIQKVQFLSVVTLQAIKGIDSKPDLEALVAHLREVGLVRQENEYILSTNLAVAKELSIQDRLQLSRLVALMGILDLKMDNAAKDAQTVAEALAESHDRADKAEHVPGAAADAAVKKAKRD